MARLAGLFDLFSPLFQKFFTALNSSIGSYALAIILLTLILKLIFLLLDFWQKYSMKYTQIKNAEMQEDLMKVQVRYGRDKNQLNQKQMEIYKKHNFNPVMGCLPMLLTLVFTLLIYTSMFNGMNVVSANLMKEQYNTLKGVYYETYETTYNASYIGNESEYDLLDYYLTPEGEKDPSYETENAQIEAQNALIQAKKDELNTASVKAAQQAVKAEYENNKDLHQGFIWIKSVWRADNFSNVIPDGNEYFKTVDKNATESAKTEYNLVMGELINADYGWNGYFILPILAFLTTWGVMELGNLGNKKNNKNQNAQTPQPNTTGLMKWMMPALMAILCFSTSSTFGIYLVASQIFSGLTTLAINPIVNVIINKKLKKQKEKIKPVISYSR